MARLNTVKSFRGTTKTESGNLRCEKCSDEITPGDGYRWWANRMPGQRGSYRRIRCMKSECTPTTADMTPGRRGQLMQIQQDGEEQIANATSVEELESVANDLADQVQEMADELRESAENIESGFGHETYQSQELNERADAMEGYAEELRDPDLEEYDELDPEDADAVRQAVLDEYGVEDEDAFAEEHEDEDFDALVETKRVEAEETKEAHLDEQREKVIDKLNEVDVY